MNKHKETTTRKQNQTKKQIPKPTQQHTFLFATKQVSNPDRLISNFYR